MTVALRQTRLAERREMRANTRKICLTFILLAALLCLSAVALATAFAPSRAKALTVAHAPLEYELNGNEYTVVGSDVWELRNNNYWDSVDRIVIAIPSTYNGKAVTAIGNNAFSHYQFNDGMQIISPKLQGIDLTGATNLRTIGESAFDDADRRSSFLPMPELFIPKSVTTIGASAFQNYNTTRINVEQGSKLTEIGYHAFSNIPTSTSFPFSNCQSLTTIGAFAFVSCAFTGALVIPDTVTSIGLGAFEACTGFTSLKLPNNPNFTTIAARAFTKCTGLTGALTIPDSVTKILTVVGRPEGRAFYGCTNFETVYLPNNTEFTCDAEDLPMTCPIVAASESLYNTYKASSRTISTLTNLTYQTSVSFNANGGALINPNLTRQEKLFGYKLNYTKNAASVWAENSSYSLPSAKSSHTTVHLNHSGYSTSQSGGGTGYPVHNSR